jgi:hypothetical protein
MQVIHQFTFRGRCPVDDAIDSYDVLITTNRLIKVEDIIKAASDLLQPLFQEDITQQLAVRLNCCVRTVGYHSGVKTTCTAE